MRNFFRTFKYCNRLNKAVLPLVIIYRLSKTAIPFVTLLFAGRIINSLAAGTSFEALLPSILTMSIINLALYIASALSSHFLFMQAEFLEYKLTYMISEKSFRIPFDVYERQETRELITKAEDGSMSNGSIESFISYAIGSVIDSVASIVYSLILFADAFISIESQNADPAFAFLNNPWSSLIIIGMVVLVAFLNIFLGIFWNRNQRDFFLKNVEINRRGNYVSGLADNAMLAKDMRVYGMEDLVASIIEDEVANEVKIYSGLIKGMIIYRLATFALSFLCLSATYFFVGGKAYYDIIPIGSIVTLSGAVSTLSSGLSSLVNGLVTTKLQVSYLSYFFDYLELPEEDDSGDPLPEGEGILAFENVSFTYPHTSIPALDDVSFAITPNRKTAIVGPNGAGKSTIIKLVSGLYKPEKGRITYNGVDIQTLNKSQYGRLLAVLHQDFSLFPFTLGQNVAAKEDYDHAKVEESLRLADFDLKSAPDGLETQILSSSSATGKDFSGGEKQKIAIARALCKDSPFVLLDEPTSALDPQSELMVYTAMSTLVENKTSLFISHRMSSTKFCDDIIVLDKGKVVEEGSHESLIKENGLYARMFNEQAKYYR